MTLEDRIKHTGEHFLGSFDTDPTLPRLIEERLALRIRRRRQRTAAGLGVGAVVVFGGLAVVNIERDPAPPVAAPTDRPAELAPVSVTPAPVATTVAAPVRTLESTTIAAPATDPVATEPAPVTVVAPIADDAPMLYTASTEGAVVQVDLRTGGTSELTDATLSTVAPMVAAVAASYALVTDDSRRDRCGQAALAGPAVESGTGALPTHAAVLVFSDDGSRGVVEYATCPETGTAADGPLVTAGPTTVAVFSPADPSAPLTPVEGVVSLLEVSADGRFLLSGSSDALYVTDTVGGGTTPVATGCESFRADPATGFLLGTDGFAALAWCNGEPAVVAGPIGAVEQMGTPGCGRESELTVRADTAGDLADGWFAVHDHAAGLAWVVSPHGVSAPIPVGEHVAWNLNT